MTAVIEIKNAQKKFAKTLALDGVDLEVPAGVVFGLLGENGAGKTTLIRSLIGFLSLDAGTVTVLGMDPKSNPLAVRKRVGYVSDAPAMYDWMTVEQVGWFASGFYDANFPVAYKRYAEQFGLPPATKIKGLSKGMRAKTALALALAADPELLILDEPTSGLDPMVRRSFLESMVDRAAAGKTVFLSSHQVQEVERVADWIAVLHRGKMRLVGPLEELKESHQVVTLSLQDPLVPISVNIDPGNCQYGQRSGRQWRLIMSNWEDRYVDLFREIPDLIDISIDRPSLEDLYIAYTQPSDPDLQLVFGLDSELDSKLNDVAVSRQRYLRTAGRRMLEEG